MSEDKKKITDREETKEMNEESGQELSPTWAQDALADLDDWIEEQGIYLRQ